MTKFDLFLNEMSVDIFFRCEPIHFLSQKVINCGKSRLTLSNSPKILIKKGSSVVWLLTTDCCNAQWSIDSAKTTDVHNIKHLLPFINMK